MSTDSVVATTPPPFTLPIPHELNDGDDESDDTPPKMGRAEAQEFRLVNNDSTLTEETTYVMVQAATPCKVTLPPIRGHRTLRIHIALAQCGEYDKQAHLVVPHHESELIHNNNSYLLNKNALFVSHRQKWYVF